MKNAAMVEFFKNAREQLGGGALAAIAIYAVITATYLFMEWIIHRFLKKSEHLVDAKIVLGCVTSTAVTSFFVAIGWSTMAAFCAFFGFFAYLGLMFRIWNHSVSMICGKTSQV